MALGDNTSNDIPLGVGYDANGNAKSFVELKKTDNRIGVMQGVTVPLVV